MIDTNMKYHPAGFREHYVALGAVKTLLFGILLLVLLPGCTSNKGSVSSQRAANLPPVVPCDSSITIKKTLHFQEQPIRLKDVAYLTTGTATDWGIDSLMVLKIHKSNKIAGSRFTQHVFPEMTHVAPEIYATFFEMDVSILEKKWVTGAIPRTQYVGGNSVSDSLHDRRVKRFEQFFRAPHGKPWQLIILVSQFLKSESYSVDHSTMAASQYSASGKKYAPVIQIRFVILDAKTDQPVFANVYKYHCDFRDQAVFSKALMEVLTDCRNDLNGFTGV